jgi:hypothetical protein
MTAKPLSAPLDIHQLANPLELLEHYVALVQKDLEEGKVENVVQHLRTICVIGAHLELQLRTGAMDGLPKPLKSVASDEPVQVLGRRPSKKSIELTNGILDELRRAGRPLQVQELMTRIEKNGSDLPGKGTSANLIAHLRRMPNVRRVARGLYTLAE